MRLAFRLHLILILSLISGNLVAGAPDEVQAQTPTKIAETVRNRKDFFRLQDQQVTITGRYLPCRQAFEDIASRIEREFQEANPGSSIHMSRNLAGIPSDWAGILLEDGFFLLIFQDENHASHRSAVEMNNFSGKRVTARGVVRRGVGQETVLADGHVVLDRLELDAPAVVRSGEDLKQLSDRDAKVVGRYVLYSKIFREFSEHMRFNFDQRAEGIHFRGIFQIPKDAPQDWAGILLEDGSLIFLFNPDDPRAHRPLREWKKLAGRKVAAYGEVRKQWGEWGKKLLSYGYADAYLDLDRIEIVF